MPGEALEAYAGLWGKLPATGDFVARGLPDAFRARWDGWVTRHLARWDAWPEDGLRLLLRSGERCALAVLVPSRDAAGRRFPLSALLVLPAAPAREGAEAWCGAAARLLARAVGGDLDADALWLGLDALDRPEAAAAEPPPLMVWAAGSEPVEADPAEPGPALAALSSR